MQLKSPRNSKLKILLTALLNHKCNHLDLLRTGPIALGAWTVTGWLKRIRLQKVSQFDLELTLIPLPSKVKDYFLCPAKVEDGGQR